LKGTAIAEKPSKGEEAMITRRTLLATGAAVIAMPAVVRAAPIKLKLSHYLPPQHQGHKEFQRWADELRKKTDGQLDIEIFPAGQMGPPPRQFDLARTGVADLAFVYTALNPGRFPLTDMLGAPFLFAKADRRPISTAEASLITTDFRPRLAREYAGTEVLYFVVSTALGLFMRDKTVHTPDDLKGLRIRPTSATAASHIQAWGASPTTIGPTELADALAKGVVDGAIFNFEGGKVFQLQQAVKHVSLIADSVGIFTLVINSQTMRGLPKDLQQAITETTGPATGQRVGGLYDASEAAGHKVFTEAGVETIEIVGEAAAAFEQKTKAITEQQIAALESKGLKARQLLADVRTRVAKV
jgi:TRAP-type C4-dicarboxylate transport system substrate-binding protein